MFSVIKSLAKHSVIYGLGDLLSKSIGFILIPVYTHYLSTEEYGTLELLDLTSYIIGLLLAMGIAQSVVRYYYEYEDQKRKNQVISVAMLTIWAVCLFVLFVLFYFSDRISTLVFNAPDYSHLFNIIFITMVINLSNEIPTTLLRIQQRSVFFVVISLARLVLNLTLNIVFIVHYGLGVLGILYGGLIASAVTGVFLTVYTLRQTGLAYSLDIAKAMLKYGFPLVGSWLGMFVLNFGDRFLLQRLATLSDVGIYSLAYKFGMLPNVLILAPFSRIWAPKQFEIVKEPDALPTYGLVFTYFIYIQLFVGLGILVLIRDILIIIADPEYHSAYQYVILILISYIFYGAYSFTQFGILLKKKTKYLGITALIGAVLNIVLNLLLIPPFKIWGAAIATICSFAFLLICVFPIAQHFYRIPYELGRLVKMVLTAAGLYVIALYINPTNIYSSITVKFVIALCFPVVLYLIGFYHREEREKARELKARVCNILKRKPKPPASER
ncbi:MAG: oligosaccharide flippase family protein [candidate division Zixibacteria bacterium]|nr:oligosaccharide flippase family protein [candidate division Zixibacteria bacterium]